MQHFCCRLLSCSQAYASWLYDEHEENRVTGTWSTCDRVAVCLMWQSLLRHLLAYCGGTENQGSGNDSQGLFWHEPEVSFRDLDRLTEARCTSQCIVWHDVTVCGILSKLRSLHCFHEIFENLGAPWGSLTSTVACWTRRCRSSRLGNCAGCSLCLMFAPPIFSAIS